MKRKQPANPWLKSDSNLQKGSESVYCQELDVFEYLRLQRERAMSRYLTRCKTPNTVSPTCEGTKTTTPSCGP